MLPFSQELLNQRFRHRYYRMLLALGGARAICENTRETGNIRRLFHWSEVLNHHRINKVAPIIFDCKANKPPQRLYVFSGKKNSHG